jgi:hypothetical protein
MTLPPDVPRANFTISNDAKRGIEWLRRDYDAHVADPADVVTIAWARFMPTGSPPFENVFVAFYGRSRLYRASKSLSCPLRWTSRNSRARSSTLRRSAGSFCARERSETRL